VAQGSALYHLNQIKQKYGATPQNYQTDDVFNQDIKPQENGDLSIGRTVKHAKFGFGTVLKWGYYNSILI
jgi:DNA helicase-2/ATP-dependent DNA helicase PcrA